MQGCVSDRWGMQTTAIHVNSKNMEVTVSRGGGGGWEIARGGVRSLRPTVPPAVTRGGGQGNEGPSLRTGDRQNNA